MNRQFDERRGALARTIGRCSRSVSVLAILLTSGCGGTDGQSILGRAVDDYHRARYQSALEHTDEIKDVGGSYYEAAYVAGLSAYRLGLLHRARSELIVAARGRDPMIAARARATLALVDLKDGRYDDAAAGFVRAASELEERDAVHAAYYAARALHLAGQEERSTHWYRVAAGRGGTSPASIGRAPVGPAFTIQVGAFRDRHHAERAAADATTLIRGYGLPPATIVTRRNDRGPTLFVVQFGRFATRSEAVDTRSRLGRTRFIISHLDT